MSHSQKDRRGISAPVPACLFFFQKASAERQLERSIALIVEYKVTDLPPLPFEANERELRCEYEGLAKVRRKVHAFTSAQKISVLQTRNQQQKVVDNNSEYCDQTLRVYRRNRRDLRRCHKQNKVCRYRVMQMGLIFCKPSSRLNPFPKVSCFVSFNY